MVFAGQPLARDIKTMRHRSLGAFWNLSWSSCCFLRYIYIYIVFGYSIWPVCAVMSKWALAIFPFTNKSSRVGVEHWPGVIYSIQKYVYILLTLRFIKGCCSRGSNFPISLLCVMCFPHLHPSN